MEDQRRYIVQVARGKFFKAFGDDDDEGIDATDVPSWALLTDDYNLAVRTADYLRRRGYPQSCVCDLRGNPLTWTALKEQQKLEEERLEEQRLEQRRLEQQRPAEKAAEERRAPQRRKRKKISEEPSMERIIKDFLSSDHRKTFIEYVRDLAAPQEADREEIA